MASEEQEKKVKISDKTEVSAAELGIILGLSVDRIYQLRREGTIDASRRGVFPLADSVQRYVGYITGEPVTEEDLKLERAKQTAEVTYKASRARKAKLEADELEGRMHRSEDVAAMTEDLIFEIRGALLALPGRLAVDVVAASSAAEASEIIKREVYAVMGELSRYRYDPKKYDERVRERLNMEMMDDGGDDE